MASISLKNVYSSSEKASENILFAVGHPLLDVSANVTEQFLEKYDLRGDIFWPFCGVFDWRRVFGSEMV